MRNDWKSQIAFGSCIAVIYVKSVWYEVQHYSKLILSMYELYFLHVHVYNNVNIEWIQYMYVMISPTDN